MPQHERPARDRWPVLPSTTRQLAFDTPARAFLAADGWEECRFDHQLRRKRRSSERALVLARGAFVVLAVVALALCARLAAKLFVGSVSAVAPVAVLVEPRLD